MTSKKDKAQIAMLTFNPKAVAYSLGILANLAQFKISYFINENINDPILKNGNLEILGFVNIANHIKPLSNEDQNFFQKILSPAYLKPNLEQIEELLILENDLPNDPSIQTILIIGSPAIVDTDDLSAFPKLKTLNDKYANHGLIKASKGQVAVAFKKFEQQQAKDGPGLKNAKMGEVVTRFPPEPSGYLHIGHSKAAILNSYFAQKYNGKLHFRLDDTNPAKENPDFVQNIQKDLKTLGVEYQSMSYTSDHFDLIQKYCEQMIKEGFAYCDQTVQEVMKVQRMNGEISSFRDNSVEENLRLWAEMLKGSEEGLKTCVRAKEDTCMQNPNKCMRDFVIYRCSQAEHHRTGDKYKAYPTYDFACPIVDSIEGITHALRTTEFLDRNEQYEWICKKLNLRCPIIQDFSRLRMQYSLMSKRHLAWFVDQGKVSGWMDPRFPTVQGMNRRGLRIDALRDFIIDQGASRRVNYQEWSKLWAINKGYLEPSAFRFHNILGSGIEVTLVGVKEGDQEVPLHPKNGKLGKKKIHVSSKILISESDIDDIKAQKPEKVTLMNLGNFKVNSEREWELLENDNNFTGTLKLTWLPAGFTNQTVSLRYFSQLCTKPMLGPDDDFKDYVNEHSMREFTGLVQDNFLDYVKEHDTVQLERVGFFYIDKINEEGVTPRIIMHYVPDGSKKRIRIGNQEFDDE